MSDDWKPPPAGAARTANRIIVPWLGSRFHLPLSRRLMLLRYTGRRTGREYTIPVAYHRWDDDEVLATSTHDVWTRSLRGGQPVRLRIRGRWLAAKPTVVEDRAVVAEMLAWFVAHRGPRAAAGLRVGLPGDRPASPEQLSRAAARVRLVRFRLME